MRKRLLRVLIVMLPLVAVGLLAYWCFVPRGHITIVQMHSIQPGMSLQEVEAIFGCPPGNYSWGGWAEYFGGGPDEMKLGPEWAGDQICVQVVFDQNGRVVQPIMGFVAYPDRSFGRWRRDLRFRWGLESEIKM